MTLPTVRDVVLDILRAHDIRTIFGNPGSTELPLLADLPADLRYVLGLQESVVVAMADGFAQAQRAPAIVNLHSSAGVGHALGSIYNAFRNQTPLVIIAGQQARSILRFAPYLHAERPTEFPQPFVKWAVEPARPEDVPGAITRALSVAAAAPYGPVFVSVPADDWLVQTNDFDHGPILAACNPGDPLKLQEIAEKLAASRRPTLVIGAGVARDQAQQAVLTLAVLHQARVWAAPMSARNGFPEDHPLFQGFLPPRRAELVQALGVTDFVIAIGGPLNLYHVPGGGAHLPPRCEIALIDDNPSTLLSAPRGMALLANTRLAVEALLDGRAPPPRPAPDHRLREELPQRTPLSDAFVFARVAALRPPEAIIVEEAPSSRSALREHLPIIIQDGFFTAASGGLGFGLPAAVGVALARPDARVIAIIGDGSAMYGIQAFWTAAKHKARIAFLILRNGRYQAVIDLAGPSVRVPGSEIEGLDFVNLGAGMGLPAVAVDDARTLDRALAEAFVADGPCIVEVRVS